MATDSLIDINIKSEIPYIVLINEISFLKSKLIHILLNIQKSEAVILLCHRFHFMENKIAQSYLEHYIKSLQSNINLRLASLSDVVNKDILHHYELHIKWLFTLSEAIRLKDPLTVPEKDPTLCHFGKWLLSDAKLLISNNSKYNKLILLHETLHYLGKKIAYYLEHVDENFHVCISYLEKADLTSMEIGTELMLIDNKHMIASAAKDELTGVLNRSLLEQIFLNQYEIALATNSSYIFAMCDLDYAKGKQVLTKVCNKVNHIPVEYEGPKIHITVSIGLIDITPQTHLRQSEQGNFTHLLQQTDKKLYLAKHNGRNRVE